MVDRCLSAVGMFWMAVLLASSQSTSSIGLDTPLYAFADVTVDGADNDMVDFGFYIPGKISGVVWNATDSNWDGIRDKNEKGLRGVNVSLYNESTHKVVCSEFSNDTGYYTFEDVPYGKYKVKTGVGQERRYYQTGNKIIRVLELIDSDLTWWPTQLGNDCHDHDGALVIIDRDNLVNMTINFGYRGVR